MLLLRLDLTSLLYMQMHRYIISIPYHVSDYTVVSVTGREFLPIWKKMENVVVGLYIVAINKLV